MDETFNLLDHVKKIGDLSVSCIIPFYNGSEFIKRALQSISVQTVQPDEVIVVNDGSRPDESDFIRNLAANKGFTLIEQKNGGQGSARNTGVKAAKSNFICFLDQDDFYLPEHIEVLKNSIPLNDRLFGYVYSNVIDSDEKGHFHYIYHKKSHTQDPKRDIMNMLLYDLYILPSSIIISRDAFLAVGGFDTQFMGYEDDDLFLRIFRAGFTNYYLEKPLSVWCMNMSSTSYSMKFIRSQFKYFKKLHNLFPDNFARKEYYLRDCLVPRFEERFIYNVVKLKTSDNTADFEETLDYLREYLEIIENSGISNADINRVRKQYLMLKNTSIRTYKFILKMNSIKLKLDSFVRKCKRHIFFFRTYN